LFSCLNCNIIFASYTSWYLFSVCNVLTANLSILAIVCSYAVCYSSSMTLNQFQLPDVNLVLLKEKLHLLCFWCKNRLFYRNYSFKQMCLMFFLEIFYSYFVFFCHLFHFGLFWFVDGSGYHGIWLSLI